MSSFKPLDKVKNETAVFFVKLVGDTAYCSGFTTQLRVVGVFARDKVFNRYAKCAGNFNPRFDRGHLPSCVQVVIKAIFAYAGFCRQFLYKHTGVGQFGLQIFLKSHTLIIVG